MLSLFLGFAQNAPAPDTAVAEVRVVGDPLRDPIAPKDPAVAGSVVTHERLALPGLEAQDVLRTQPGVVVTESGGFGAPATAAIRGATAADTPTYLAGIRLNDDVGGTADLSLVPLWLIDRIEIYRGNAPLEADRLGPGGAIFFEPRQPAKAAGKGTDRASAELGGTSSHGTSSGGVGYYGGSWGASKGWVYEGAAKGPVTVLGGVSLDHATNRYPFVDDHGTLFEPGKATPAVRGNADETSLEGWSLAHVELGGGATLDLLANGISREQGVPSLALVPTREARQRSDRVLAGLSLGVPFMFGHDRRGRKSRAKIDAQTSFLLGSTDIFDPLLELALFAKRVRVVGRRVEQRVGATFDVTDTLRLRPVITVAHEEISRDPDDIPLARAHREFGRVALSAEDRVTDGLTLRALGSVECHHTGAGGDGPCDVLEPTGRAGVEVGHRRLELLANVGRYVRVPTLGEVYGVSGAVHGNPALAPETGSTADLGVRAQTAAGTRLFGLEGAYADAFVFARWAGGLIAYERTGQGYVTPYNVGAARVLGAEFLGGLLLTRVLRLETAATALDPRDTSPARTVVNDILPFRSRLIVAPRLRADWKWQNRIGISGIGGEVSGLYQSSRYVDPAGLGVIGEQVTFDAEVDVTFFNGLLVTRLRVADVFDAVRTDIVGYPLPGRSGYAGVEATW